MACQDVKLLQVDMLLRRVSARIEAMQTVVDIKDVGTEVALIIGGDFNSLPNSEVYRLLSTGIHVSWNTVCITIRLYIRCVH